MSAARTFGTCVLAVTAMVGVSNALAWDTGSCGARTSYNPSNPPVGPVGCMCTYEYALDQCSGTYLWNGCHKPAFTNAVSCFNTQSVVLDAYHLYKQVAGTESHAFTISQELTSYPIVWIINAAGVTSATLNVSSVAVDINSGSLVSNFTGQETTTTYEPSSSDTFTVTTTGSSADFVTIFVTTPLE